MISGRLFEYKTSGHGSVLSIPGVVTKTDHVQRSTCHRYQCHIAVIAFNKYAQIDIVHERVCSVWFFKFLYSAVSRHRWCHYSYVLSILRYIVATLPGPVVFDHAVYLKKTISIYRSIYYHFTRWHHSERIKPGLSGE